MLIWFLVAPAFAGERFLAWSYGAATVPEGEVELEPISTVETHQEAGTRVAEWTHEVELETGITNALEGGLYLVTTQTDDGPLAFSGYKARIRYRFWPLGSRAVDLAAYVEYIGTPTFESHGLEGKFIIAHEGDQVRAAVNLTAEFILSPDGVEPTLEPTAGVAWRATPHVALGVEGKFETVLVTPVEGPFLWAGPTLHLAGQGGTLWWTVSGMYGLTAATRGDAIVEARSLIGIDL